jgi:hypothetical protein
MDAGFSEDWTKRDLADIVVFFTWMDALNRESVRRGLREAWPVSADMAQRLNDWIIMLDQGLSPAQAIEQPLR